MALRITSISKTGGSRAAISHFGWINDTTGKRGSSDRETMWLFVTKGGMAYVRDASGHVAHVYAKMNRWGTRFVQTAADGLPSDNLLTLPKR